MFTVTKIADIILTAVIVIPVLIGSAVAIAYAIKRQKEENEKF